MKAFLLAAGLGTRLRPISDHTPKCLIEIGGQSMLDIWLDAMDRAGIDEVLINLHHLPELVRTHLEGRTAPPRTRWVFEPELLGSAGTLLANRGWIEGEELFLACNADNLTDFDVRRLIDQHRAGGEIATLAVFHAEKPSACGIVDLDETGRIIAFTEKPADPTSDLANAGMYAFHPSVLEGIDAPPPIDIGYHLLPRLVGRTQSILVDGYFRDIGTIAAYERALAEWPARGTP